MDIAAVRSTRHCKFMIKYYNEMSKDMSFVVFDIETPNEKHNRLFAEREAMCKKLIQKGWAHVEPLPEGVE